MSLPTPKLVNNEEKPAIIQIRIVNPADDYERTFEHRCPYLLQILF